MVSSLKKVASASALALVLMLCISSKADAQATNMLYANFDDLSPGTYSSNSITDGGITFTNLYVDSTGDSDDLGIGTTTDTSFGFSGTNFLTSGGDPDAFGSIYSVDITFSGLATNASLTVGAYGDTNESNTLTLEAFNGNNLVATNTFAGFATNNYDEISGNLSTTWSPGITSLMLIVNVLDTNTNSPDYGNDFLTFGISNVQLTGAMVVPEPSGSGLLACALLSCGALLYVRSQSRKGQKASIACSPADQDL